MPADLQVNVPLNPKLRSVFSQLPCKLDLNF